MTRPATSLAVAALMAAGFILGACSGGEGAASPAAPAAPAPPAVPAQTPPAPTPAPAPPPPQPTPTVGGDGSAIELSPLTAKDIEAAALSGELACAFSTPGAPTLLLARGDVASRDPAFGVVKAGDYVERVAAPGGFDGMAKGAVFSGRGKTIRIALTGPAIGGGESPPRPATLTYQRADGAERVFVGAWTCGP
ncbi:hypothetical protein [Phenylobacterium sp.]|uniref:hypothetical protein n=1 Tax=Phenylobacterium sp. TaxID=1871053 RepID=UPI00391BFEBD